MKWWISAVVRALLALTGWVSMEFRQDMQRHGERVRHGSRMLQTACGNIELGEAGPPDGPPLLMIHGSGGGFDQGPTLGRDLAARGLRVIALRLPAHAVSGRPIAPAPSRPSGLLA